MEARWLNQAGHRAWIVCNPDSELQRRAPDLCLPVRMRNSIDAPACARIQRLCRRLAIDVVHVHSPKDAWICYPLHVARFPVVRSRQITNPVKRKWSRSIVYRRGCARVIATADCIRHDLIRHNGVSPARISVVGEGVDTNVFRPDIDGSAWRARFGVADTALLFGIVAMIRPEKGHLTFVQAGEALLASHPNARFAIVGEGTGKRETEQAVRTRLQHLFRSATEGPIFMTGYCNDPATVMAALDVLVVPSSAEAQSLVVPQAFATRRAVIASNVGGLPELVRNGDTGLLVPPSDPTALAAAMRQLAEDPELRARLADGGYRLAREHLSIDGKMKQLLGIYDEVTAPRRRRALPRKRAEILPFRSALPHARRGLRYASQLAAAAVIAWFSLVGTHREPVEQDFRSRNFSLSVTGVRARLERTVTVGTQAETVDDDEESLTVLPEDGDEDVLT